MRWAVALALGSGCAAPAAADTEGEVGGSSGAAVCVVGEVRSCYSGPDGTVDVGACRAGVARCEGGAWGVCEGEVVPRAEEDACEEDRACDGPCAAHRWSRAYAGTRGMYVSGAAIDAAGDVVVVGAMRGEYDFGGEKLVGKTGYDLWVGKFAPDGTHRWSRTLGGWSPEDGATPFYGAMEGGVALEASSGDLLISGRCVDLVDGGEGLVGGAALDPLIARLTADGEVRWMHRLVGDGDVDGAMPGFFVAPATGGETWVAGTLQGSAKLAGATYTSTGWGDWMVMRLAPDGAPITVSQLGNEGHQEIGGIAGTPDGGVVIAGAVEGAMTIVGVEIASVGLDDAVALRLGPSGRLEWWRRFGDKRRQAATAVAIAGEQLLLAGRFEGTLDLGGAPLQGGLADGEWDEDLFVAAFDLAGEHRWSRAIEARSGWGGVAIAGASAAYVLLAGGALGLPSDVGFGSASRLGDPEGPWVGLFSARDGAPRWLFVIEDVYDVFYQAIAPAGVVRGDAVTLVFGDRGWHDLGGGPLGATNHYALFMAEFQR